MCVLMTEISDLFNRRDMESSYIDLNENWSFRE